MHPALPIVVADTTEAFEHLRDSLARALPLVHVDTLGAAQRAIVPGTPLVVCGCHFDEDRMYDLLRYMKASGTLGRIPFLATRLLPDALEDTLYESVKIATRALGASGFVDLYRLQRKYGEVEAAQRLTARIEALAGRDTSDGTSA
jgi:hypothetical protein